MSSLHQNVNSFSQLSYDIFPKWPHTHPHLWFHSLLHISKFSYVDKQNKITQCESWKMGGAK